MEKEREQTGDKWPWGDPRVAGVREHYERMRLFLDLARNMTDPVARFRLMLASVYSARAIIELHFEAAEKQQLPTTREELKKTLLTMLPWVNLIERIRIHDFHRFGLTPPNPALKMSFQGGPIKLRAQKGAAVYMVQADGPKSIVTGNSSIDEQRPLLRQDDTFFDDDTKEYVTLERILLDFITALPAVIAKFEQEILP